MFDQRVDNGEEQGYHVLDVGGLAFAIRNFSEIDSYLGIGIGSA